MSCHSLRTGRESDCSRYLLGVANIEAGVLFKDKYTIKWHICPDLAQALFNWWG